MGADAGWNGGFEMTYKLTIDDIRMLAEQERRMDSGEQPHVLDTNRNRWCVSAEVMEELGLVSRQQVSHAIITAILEAHLASVQARIALDAATQGDRHAAD